MNAQTELNTYTADMLRFHPPRLCAQQGEVLAHYLWVNACNRFRPGYQKSPTWKTLNKKRLIKDLVHFFLNHFRTIFNRTANQGLRYYYENPLGEFLLQFHFSADKLSGR